MAQNGEHEAEVIPIDHRVSGREDMEKALTWLLEEVRAGRVDGYAIAILFSNHDTGTRFGYVTDRSRPFAMTGAVEYLKQRVMREIEE